MSISDWYLVKASVYTDSKAKREWCIQRWGESYRKDRNGVWFHSWEGFRFKKESDYFEFLMVWS